MAADHEQAKGEAAMHTVITRQIDVPEAMHRAEIGLVDFRYGQPGDAARNYAGGHGIAKVLAKHGEAVARKIPVVIAHGRLTQLNERAFIEHQSVRVVLANNWKGAPSNHWVVTGYEKTGASR